ncbi:PfkB family carbohydrate kinase [Paucilactobacillus hokkaidonensis JCM 18461]|uniref:PfkB family carbohydrate kinase n=2 Tax=Paucilactobacillus hokkaidonensis TaxID=1193095 RepID=A0A0A1GV12_9LACO|nr:kdgK protein [Paucilactobacillus hokkaidonensis]BAP85840.1 PfkB family carbohydrate kinase [Paucilactobacillus hokkaidonensis JCM 18461]
MKILTFGEMMLRLKTPDNERLIQANKFEVSYGGSEANVAVSLALLDDNAAFLTKLPPNLLGDSAEATLLKHHVDTGGIHRGGARMGIYFFEKGASVRPTNVVYDRAGSSFSTVDANEFNWEKILTDVDYFYFSGITPALSDQLQLATLKACQYCQTHQIPIICDLNYRSKLWSPEKAQKVMGELMQYVNVCLAHDEDFIATLGIEAFDGDMRHGIEQKDQFKKSMKAVTEKYPQCHTIASVLRDINSVEDSQWTSILLRDGKFYEAPIYQMHVMEGVAAGDAFGAGIVHGLVNNFVPQEQINYAMAASVLKLTISGDLNLVSDQEIRSLMESRGGSGMKR